MKVELEYIAVDSDGDTRARGATIQELEDDLKETLSWASTDISGPLTIEIIHRRWFGD